MFCSHCGAETQEKARFCRNCGNSLNVNTPSDIKPAQEATVLRENAVQDVVSRRGGTFISKLSLLFCLLILALSSYVLLYDLYNVSIYWEEIVFLVGSAGIVFLIVRKVGGTLDRRFTLQITEFMHGQRKSLFDDPKMLSAYGLLLLTLLPYLLYLLVLALYLAIVFAIFGFYAISFAPRIPIVIPIALAVVVLGTGLAMLIGFYYLVFPPNRKPIGIELSPHSNLKIWRFVGDLARKLKTRPISTIIVLPTAGIGVYMRGNIISRLLGRGERILEIGISSLHGLSVSEFEAILAHEYGHFSNRDTQWGSFTHAMGTSLIGAFQSMPGPSQDENEEGGWFRLILSLNPGYWVTFLFINLFFKVTKGFSRVREVMSDIHAMTMFGGKPFRMGLLKVATNDLITDRYVFESLIPQLLSDGKVPGDFSIIMESAHKTLGTEKVKELRNAILTERESGAFDSHPAIGMRVEYSKMFTQVVVEKKEPVATLFDDWGALNENVAEVYSKALVERLAAMPTQQEDSTGGIEQADANTQGQTEPSVQPKVKKKLPTWLDYTRKAVTGTILVLGFGAILLIIWAVLSEA